MEVLEERFWFDLDESSVIRGGLLFRTELPMIHIVIVITQPLYA